MFGHLTELVTDGDDCDNFWVCQTCGETEPSKSGDRACLDVESLLVLGVRRCAVCNGQLRLKMRKQIALRNIWE